MKYKILIPAVLLAAMVVGSSMAMKPKKLKQSVVLQMPGDKGNNGAGVAWNPQKKLYYAAYAGNSTYPMAVFNAKGVLQQGPVEAGFDIRGLWYNAKTNRVEGNSYTTYDAYYYKKLDDKGLLMDGAEYIFEPDEYGEEEIQPDDQSVGAFIAANDEVVFRDKLKLYFYNRTDGKLKRSNAIEGLPVEDESLNGYTVIYTGLPKMEIGVMDKDNRKIYLINMATSRFTKELKLPDTAPVEFSFNFSYANGLYWLFNRKDKKWYGYK